MEQYKANGYSVVCCLSSVVNLFLRTASLAAPGLATLLQLSHVHAAIIP